MAVTLAFSPVTAEAKTNVHIGIGIGGYDPCYNDPWRWNCDSGPRYYGYYDDRYDPYFRDAPRRYYRDARVSCGEAKQLLRDRGYRRINSRDCNGRTYVFTAVKRGNYYRIEVRARNGAVLSVERI